MKSSGTEVSKFQASATKYCRH